METNKTATTTEAWLAARLELLALEKQHTRRGDELAALRRNLPKQPVSKDYVFDGPDGPLTLGDLFGSHSQLIVYHFMYGDDWEQPCVCCSFWADHFAGMLPHLGRRDAAFAAISNASVGKLDAFKARMGWQHTWVSAGGSTFNADFGVSFEKIGDVIRGDYNYGTESEPDMEEKQGISVFTKDENGAVFHTYSSFGRGVEASNGTYSLLDLLPKGRDEGSLPWTMAWVGFSDGPE